MTLTEEQRTVHFHDEDNRPITLRVIQPSVPSGAWVGNEVTIREWQISRVDEVHFTAMFDHEVRAAEASLGEIDLDKLRFFEHRALGRVATADAQPAGRVSC